MLGKYRGCERKAGEMGEIACGDPRQRVRNADSRFLLLRLVIADNKNAIAVRGLKVGVGRLPGREGVGAREVWRQARCVGFDISPCPLVLWTQSGPVPRHAATGTASGETMRPHNRRSSSAAADRHRASHPGVAPAVLTRVRGEVRIRSRSAVPAARSLDCWHHHHHHRAACYKCRRYHRPRRSPAAATTRRASPVKSIVVTRK
ncbi:hypothetical protein BDK51DRAFT_47114 [Blyttiomyces helicus]|uniref:Uncharacterized protein n=1 Tax=Blyttiomyces helicus TaxID=388810 RepID=A0A4P9WCI5_9FUNG|nr:hypothetical protein BDK51DRAFT_47114 [Blyttiomyces helicus]|eukprot:RKO90032.1 hypothetical protein BDK51DRAFT_47114 [Blyttiomyces helicus]